MDISGLDKARVLQGLYAVAQPLGLGMLQFTPEPMSYEEAQTLVSEFKYFDYLHGRVMKIDISKDDLDTRLFNRDNGEGTAEAVIESLRSQIAATK